MKKKIIAGISGLTLAAGLGLGVTQLANADSSESPTPTATSTAAPEEHGKPHGDKGRRGPDLAALAEKLGVTQEQLAEALQATHEATKPSADQGPEAGGDREAARAEHHAALVKAVAEKLGLEEAKVQAAFDEVHAAKQEERSAAAKEKLASAVADQKLTQEEADAVQKAIDAGIVSIGGGKHR